MWEAARDSALENPSIPGDVLMRVIDQETGAPIVVSQQIAPFQQIQHNGILRNLLGDA